MTCKQVITALANEAIAKGDIKTHLYMIRLAAKCSK